MGPSIWQILIVVAVIMILFGAGRLPRIMEDLAKGIKSFKHGLKDDDATKSVEHKADKTDKTGE
jgi:sec-independent protein translocase protein TatA